MGIAVVSIYAGKLEFPEFHTQLYDDWWQALQDLSKVKITWRCTFRLSIIYVEHI